MLMVEDTKTFVNEFTRNMHGVLPPAAVSGLAFMGISLNEWVYILTIIYLLVQLTKPVFKLVWSAYVGRQ